MRDEPALDVLIIDEAGQMGLADALAATASATNVVLLGDPLQLAQVSQAIHPGGAGASTLEHVLGPGVATMPANQGVFLDTTWRMHGDLCGFLSTHIYDGRLRSHADCANQSVGGQTGLRWIRAEHNGCSTESAVEADLVVDTVRSLIGQSWKDFKGHERPMTAADVMIVAPYNHHVDLIRATLDTDPALAAARVGTVDKFQGQEAPVVIFTMATSAAADMPRTSEFLFSRQRLNVAISRARALAYVTCTNELLDARARSVEEMKLIGTLCAFVERAQMVQR
jgi:superfamily I DNA and/or RNA helicase